jgi:hypothetical protein
MEMKLSIEAKVASTVAAGFLAVTVGVVAQANGAAAAGASDGYGLMNIPAVNTHIVQQKYDSLSGGTTAKENAKKFSIRMPAL